ncbi:hypothetical protein DRH14_02325 [Candidatus Shapirobacteria bacterium]|nr:MAG: hypothetical protein DRH14_02325 [Candidatus Shapirobacteria bacterium]
MPTDSENLEQYRTRFLPDSPDQYRWLNSAGVHRLRVRLRYAVVECQTYHGKPWDESNRLLVETQPE